MVISFRTCAVAIAASLTVALAACGGSSTPSRSPSQEGRGAPSDVVAAKGTPARSLTGPGPVILTRGHGGSITTFNNGQPQVVQSTLPGLTVRHTERAELPADQAFAVGLYLIRNAPNPFVELSQDDKNKLLAALRGAGFAESDIVLSRNSNAGPYTQIRVRVPVGSVATDGAKVFKAISDSIGAAEQTGALFALNDCPARLAPVQRAAFAAADERAKTAATAGGLKLGPILAVSQSFGSQNPYEPSGGDPCDILSGGAFAFKGGPGQGLKAIDAPAKVDVTIELSVTYSLSGDAGSAVAGLTVTGSGKVTAKADEAYVVAFVETASGPSGPRPLSTKDREALLAALKALGVAESDVNITNQQFGGPTIVAVETKDLAKLVRFGRDVLNAVEDTVGRVQTKGAVFTHSRCDLAAAEARKEAVADAAERAAGLGGSANLKVGAVRSIAQVQIANPYGPTASDPCSDDPAAFAGGAYGGGQQLKDFSAAAEFEVTVAVMVTYAIGG